MSDEPSSAAPSERERFERWAAIGAPSLDLSPCPHKGNGEAPPPRCQRSDFHYLKYATQKAWDAWQAARAATPPAPGRWIPVENKFPDPNAYVWFWVPSLGLAGTWETGYFRDEEGDRYWECERSDSYNDSIKYDRFQVTHWMLAELPDVEVSDSGASAPERTEEK